MSDKAYSPTASTSAASAGGAARSWSRATGASALAADKRTDLWSDILQSADRASRGRSLYTKKNVILLSERHRGRTHLLSQLSSKRRAGTKDRSAPSLALGYEVIEAREDGDEDSVPPVSVFYPPSSHPSLLKLVPKSLPPNSLSDTAVVIVLDWSKPSTMIRELVQWLNWVEQWANSAAQPGQADELRERLQSHIQHYTEPTTSTAGSTTTIQSYTGGPLLPLGQGTLTLNSAGVPITIVCTRADLMDSAGEEVGMKGQWEERTDWIQQVLRTVALAYGASLFYTAPTQPDTYSLLREYLLHRLYTLPPPLNPTDQTPQTQSSPFPFAHRANVLDRDAVMVPSGWDSWGKINVLRDRFDPARVLRAWETTLTFEEGDEGETVEDLWVEMIPDTSRPKPVTASGQTTQSEPEQTFLARQLDILQKDPNRDPRASFRQAAAAVSHSGQAGAGEASAGAGTGGVGVVGPMGAGGLSLPGVEKAMAEMEGGSAEDMRDRFARLARRDTTRPGSTPGTTTTASEGRSNVPNEALHNFFQGLLANKGKATPSKTTSPAAAAAAKPE